MTGTIGTQTPTIALNNGVELPALGLGVFLAPPEQTADAVETALNTGYRLIDTAAGYNNERQVGEGIRRSGIDRDVSLARPDVDVNGPIDDAYRTKYAQYADSYTGHMVAAQARATTLVLEPR